MKRLQVKCEVWFDVDIDTSLSDAEILEKVRECGSLSDLINENMETSEAEANEYDIISKKSIWIMDNDGKTSIVDLWE